MATSLHMLVEQIEDAGTTENNKVEISAACRAVKPYFKARPSAGLVRQILHHIRDGGEPHEWWGHTHTRPPKGGALVYLEEFDLPLARFRGKVWAVCPCCAPETRKYGKAGKIGWFPDEAVIRLLGPACFRSLDQGAHDNAYRELKAEKRKQQDEAFVLSKLPLLGGVLDACQQATLVAEALDEFRADLVKVLADKRFPLWDHVRRDGKLKIVQKAKDLRVSRDGNASLVDIEVERSHADLPGYELLNPAWKPIAPKLRRAGERLEAHVLTGDWRGRVANMTDLDRHRLVRSLNFSVKTIRECISDLESGRRLAVPLTVKTLRAWGVREGCPIPSQWSHDFNHITFAKEGSFSSIVRIPPAMAKELYKVQF
ncbi:hypothetical protein GCM10019059_30850 [Camelimonas fluminis]|uniref:TniQ protein n=1 Tax=Camelimonas fluminis TaxID=1576911 RepID=A0ABV7UMJ7_9HYPH|nr:hypothetical protein [Camelimonas fluminis]GHE69019.1 hypothetical protein GCM10019059_30850 [Camelimonas fluminis]